MLAGPPIPPDRVLPSYTLVFRVALIVCGLVLGFVHYWRLDQSPPGLYADEASIGYAASGIASNGHDEHGVAWPLFFESFGDWKSPVTIYLIAAAIRFFGVSVPVIRAVPSTLTLMTAALLAWLVWRLVAQRWLALGTFAIAGVLPWLVVLGRIAFEVAAVPAALAGFLLVWRLADTRASLSFAAAAGLLLGFSAYTYATMRLFFLLVILAMVVAYWPQLRSHGRVVAASGLTAVATYVPALVWNAQHPDALTARFTQVSILTEADGVVDAIARFGRVYVSYWSPQYLFTAGDPYGRHASGHGGVLFVALAPFFALGLVGLWRNRAVPLWRLVALGVILAPVPAALTTQFGHSVRDLEALPFVALTCALGANELAVRVSEWRSRTPGTTFRAARKQALRSVVAILAVALAVEAASFVGDYFAAYPERMYWWFDAGLSQAMTAARTYGGPVVLSDQIEQPAVTWALLTGEPAQVYAQRGIAGAQVLALKDAQLPPGTVVVAKPGESVAGGEIVQQISLPTHDEWGHVAAPYVAYKIWIVRFPPPRPQFASGHEQLKL